MEYTLGQSQPPEVLKRNIAALANQIEKLTLALQQKSDEVKLLTQNLALKNEEIQRLRQNQNTQNEELNRFRTSAIVQNPQNVLLETQKTLSLKALEYEQLLSAFRAIESEYVETNKKCQEATTQNTLMNTHLHSVMHELQQVKENSQTQISQKDGQIAQLNNSVSNLQQQIQILKEANEQMKTQIVPASEMEGLHGMYKRMLEKFLNAEEESKRQLELEKNDLAQNYRSLLENEEQRVTRKLQSQYQGQNLQKIKIKNKYLLEAVEDLRQQVDLQQKQLEQKEKLSQEIIRVMLQQEEEIKRIKEGQGPQNITGQDEAYMQINMLTRQLESRTQELSRLEQENQGLRARQQDLLEKLQQQNSEISILREQLKGGQVYPVVNVGDQMKINFLKNQNDVLQNQLTQMKSSNLPPTIGFPQGIYSPQTNLKVPQVPIVQPRNQFAQGVPLQQPQIIGNPVMPRPNQQYKM